MMAECLTSMHSYTTKAGLSARPGELMTGAPRDTRSPLTNGALSGPDGIAKDGRQLQTHRFERLEVKRRLAIEWQSSGVAARSPAEADR